MYWHIGLMKTGSTYYQRKIWPNLKNKYFVGWHTKETDQQWNDPRIKNMVYKLRYDKDFKEVKYFQKLTNSLPKNTLISDEGIITDGRTQLRNIGRIKEIDQEAKVIVFVRDECQWLLSQYYQYRRGVLSGKKIDHISLEEWMEINTEKNRAVKKDLLTKNIEEYITKKNYIIIEYEDVKNNIPKVAEQLGDFLGEDKYELLKTMVIESKIEHARLKTIIPKTISRTLNKFGISRILAKGNKAMKYLAWDGYVEEDVKKVLEDRDISVDK